MDRSRFALYAALFSFLMSGASAAQVSFPDTPEKLVQNLESEAFETDLAFRTFTRAAVDFALDRESGTSCDLAEPGCKPFTQAISASLQRRLKRNGRAREIFTTQLLAGATISGPIDLYILMGQSNMVGLTESGAFNGPDPEIRAAIQEATPGRTVVTLNCALSGSLLLAWEPQTPSFVNFGSKTPQHNLARECIEAARAVTNTAGERANVRGLFFFQGEADVSLSAFFETDGPVASWGDRYIGFIEFMRVEFGDVPAVHAQLGQNRSEDAFVQALTEQMREVQAAVPERLPLSATIVTEDLELADGIHLNDASQAIAGQRFAAAMLGLLGL